MVRRFFYFSHANAMSFRYRVTLLVLRWMKWRSQRLIGPGLAGMLNKLAKASANPPIASVKDLTFNEEFMLGQSVWTVARKTSGRSTVAVIYLHGGAYAWGVTPSHWQFIVEMVRATGCVVHVPLYPRAPAHDFTQAYGFVQAVHSKILEQDPQATLLLMGDSAGGGLALGFSEVLAEQGGPMPAALVLMSPWLDIDLRDPSIPEFEKRDPWLSSSRLRAVGELWAGKASRDDFRLSPLYGPLDQLPPVHLFIGDRDLFWPDAMSLNVKLKAAGRVCHLHAEKGMCHVWPLLGISEAEPAIRNIHQIVERMASRASSLA